MDVRRKISFSLSALLLFGAGLGVSRAQSTAPAPLAPAPASPAIPFSIARAVPPAMAQPQRSQSQEGDPFQGQPPPRRPMVRDPRRPGGGTGSVYRGSGEGGGSLVQGEGGILIDEDGTRTAREVASHSTGTPEWKNPPGFEKDVFTFARIIFRYGGEATPFNRGWGRGPQLGWWVDFPDADLNFSYRLQQLTSIRTDPDGRVIKLTDPTLNDYPMVIMEHPAYILLNDVEATNLRNYLLNGGALFVSDFWSRHEWDLFEAAMKRVLPGRTYTELTIDHPIFHCVFNLKGPMQRLQVPTMQFWNTAHNWDNPAGPPLQTVDRGPGSEPMTVRAWHDDKGRIMALVIHNSDVPDGWEREGEDDRYFRTFSEKISYPLGVNIVFYLMTH
jgi:hypothetical protein